MIFKNKYFIFLIAKRKFVFPVKKMNVILIFDKLNFLFLFIICIISLEKSNSTNYTTHKTKLLMFIIYEVVKSLYHVKKICNWREFYSKKYCSIREKIVVRFGNKPMITALQAATMHQRAILASWPVSIVLSPIYRIAPFLYTCM